MYGDDIDVAFALTIEHSFFYTSIALSDFGVLEIQSVDWVTLVFVRGFLSSVDKREKYIYNTYLLFVLSL